MQPIPEFNFKGAPMSQEGTEMLVKALMNKDSDKIALEKEPLLAGSFAAQIILKRIEAYKLPFKISTFFFAAASMLLPVETPADCMILLWLCHQHNKKNGRMFIDVNEFCYIFPMGCPTESEKHAWWDSQKIPYDERPTGTIMDNRVDIAELWK